MGLVVAILVFAALFCPIGARPAAAQRQPVAIPEILRPTAGGAARPSAPALQGQVEEAFRALTDAEAARRRGATASSQRSAVRSAADRIFDWPEMARDALGKHWADTTPAQREHVTRLLPQLFERLYLPMIERTGPPKAATIADAIVFAGETVNGNDAVVHMLWRRSARDLAVDWSMRRRAGAWRIHDVALDGISLMENYRAQFDRVIQRSSYEDLVARMEAKVNSAPLVAPSRLAGPVRPAPTARPEPSADVP